MAYSLIILMSFFTLTFATSEPAVQSTSIIDSISQILYIYLNPIFQNTLTELTQLVFDFSEKIFENYGVIRVDKNVPATWVSQLFGGVNSISTQWNNQITDFFTNIPTIFENPGRSSFNFSTIKQSLYKAVEDLLEKLKGLTINTINQMVISTFGDINLSASIGRKRESFTIDQLFNVFQHQVSNMFDKTQEQLNQKIDNAIDVVLTYFNHIKDRFLELISSY